MSQAKKRARLALMVAVLVGALVVLIGWWAIAAGWLLGRDVFWRERYERVVELVRGLDVAEGDERSLILPDLADPSSLRTLQASDIPHDRYETHEGWVWARRSPGGSLCVVIETTDAGHAGEFAFLFSDAEMTPMADGMIAARGGTWSATQRIDDHWWRIENRLK